MDKLVAEFAIRRTEDKFSKRDLKELRTREACRELGEKLIKTMLDSEGQFTVRANEKTYFAEELGCQVTRITVEEILPESLEETARRLLEMQVNKPRSYT